MSIIINIWEKDHAFEFVKAKYQNNGNLAIQVMSEDEEYGGWEPWCSLTVNLDKKLPENQAYLDTNNCSREIIIWLYHNHYVSDVGVGFSGFCSYPLVEFSKAFMEMIAITEEDLYDEDDEQNN